MGSLPPGLGNELADPRLAALPFARSCELYKIGLFGEDELSGPPVGPSNPWYYGTQLQIWDSFRNDSGDTSFAATSLQNSVPYISTTPNVTTAITVSAPHNRACPFFTWASFLVYNDEAAGNYLNRFAIGHHLRGTSAGLRIIANDEFNGEYPTGGMRSFNMFGFGVVPQGETHDIFTAWDDGGGTGATLFGGGGMEWSVRNRFGVCTF